MTRDETEPIGVPEDEGADEAEDAEEGFPMRFTVIERSAGRVHLVSEGGGEVFVHPAVGEDVWAAALTDVPPAWEIVDLAGAVPVSEPTPRACRRHRDPRR